MRSFVWQQLALLLTLNILFFRWALQSLFAGQSSGVFLDSRSLQKTSPTLASWMSHISYQASVTCIGSSPIDTPTTFVFQQIALIVLSWKMQLFIKTYLCFVSLCRPYPTALAIIYLSRNHHVPRHHSNCIWKVSNLTKVLRKNMVCIMEFNF